VALRNTNRQRGRVVLTPEQPSIPLTRNGHASGTLRVNLSWGGPPGKVPGLRQSGGGRLGWLAPRRLEATPLSHDSEVDLDLGCLYEMTTGQRGVIQALGDRRGSYDRPPYVRLDRDDRLGSSTGENLFVNLDHAEAFRRLLLYTYIYAGTADFGQSSALVTLFPTGGKPIEIHLDAHEPRARCCAVGLVTRVGRDLVLRRELRYVDGYQSDLDRLYQWNLNWGVGSKDGH
jgi:tellurite resistance protein TerA